MFLSLCFKTDDENVFGNSWRTDDFFDDDLDCNDNRKCYVPPPQEDTCSALERQQAAEKCSVIQQFVESDEDAQVWDWLSDQPLSLVLG